jgi:hypothetical protein
MISPEPCNRQRSSRRPMQIEPCVLAAEHAWLSEIASADGVALGQMGAEDVLALERHDGHFHGG